MNIVEFIVKLNDQSSGPLGQFKNNAAGASNTVNELTQANNKLKDASAKSGGSISDLKAKITKLKETKELIPGSAVKQLQYVNAEIKKLESELGKVELRASGGAGGGGMFSQLKNSIPAIFTNPFLLAGAAATASLNEGFKNSKQKLNFELLLGSDAGGGLFDNLKGLKGLLGSEVFNFGETLLTGGFAANKVTDTLSRLGDVAAGNETKLSSLTSAFALIRKEGILTESSLGQLEAGGFKPLVLISQQTGESLKSVRQRAAEGKVSFQEVEAALRTATDAGGQFYGNMQAIANSPTGQLSQLTDKAMGLAASLGEFLLPAALMVVGGLSDMVGWLQPLGGFISENSGLFMTLAGVIGGVAAGIKIVTIAKTIWASVTGGLTTAIEAMNVALLSNPIGLVVGLIAGLVAGVMIAWNKFEGFRKAMYGIWETFKSVFTAIGDLFKKIFSPISEAITAFKEGRYLDAGKAVAEMAFNLTPMGLVKNVVEFTKDGGFSGVGNAYNKGAEKGAASWAASQKDKDALAATKNAVGAATPDDKAKYLAAKDLSNKTQSGINAVSGGGVKNINVTVNKMVESLTFHITNGNKQMAAEMERIAEEALTRAIVSASAK